MTHTTAPPRRRRPPEERRRQIMEAAVRLFARQGFARTTTREIAREAGIAEGTIYKHFASKHDLLFSFIESTALESARALLQHPPEDDAAFIRAFLTDRLTLVEQHRPLVKVIFGEALFDEQLAGLLRAKIVQPMLPLLERMLADRVRAGRFRRVDTETAARVLVSLFLSFGLTWPTLLPADAKRLPSKRLAGQLAAIFLDGVRAHAGEEVVR